MSVVHPVCSLALFSPEPRHGHCVVTVGNGSFPTVAQLVREESGNLLYLESRARAHRLCLEVNNRNSPSYHQLCTSPTGYFPAWVRFLPALAKRELTRNMAFRNLEGPRQKWGLFLAELLGVKGYHLPKGTQSHTCHTCPGISSSPCS